MEIHVVQQGETLSFIAQQYDLTVTQLVEANQLPDPDRLAVGEALLIPQEVVVTVQPGDSLFRIARQFGVSVTALVAANPQITNPDVILPGQLIRIPGLERERYLVRPGDTLSAIAQVREIPLSGLIRMNPQVANPNLIYPGQRLWLPVLERRRPTMTVNGYLAPSATAPARIRELAPWLTSVSLFSFPVRADGALGRPGFVTETVTAALEQGLIPLAVITNIDGGTFDRDLAHAILSDPAARRRAVAETREVVETYRFRGVNVDFENMPPEDRPLFNRFMEELAEVLRPAGHLVGLAVAPKASDRPTEPWVGTFDYATLGQIADFVVIMTYEWGWVGGPPMAVSPANLVRLVLDYAVSLIPRAKILQGINLYGYDWLRDEDPATLARTLSPPQATQLAFDTGVPILFDPKAESPWFRYTGPEGGEREVWFEDVRSMLAKYQITQVLDLAGVSFWNLIFRFPQNWQLLQRVFQVRKGRMVP